MHSFYFNGRKSSQKACSFIMVTISLKTGQHPYIEPFHLIYHKAQLFFFSKLSRNSDHIHILLIYVTGSCLFFYLFVYQILTESIHRFGENWLG